MLSIERVDLVKTCDKYSHCINHEWKVIDSFQESFINAENSPEGFKTIDKFPIVIQKIYPNSKSIDFTLRTEFEVPPEYLNTDVNPGLHIDAIGDVYRFYLNGKFIGSEGKAENGKIVKSRYGNNLNYSLNFSNFKQGKNVLIIHLQGDPRFNLLGLFRTNGYYFDDYNEILYESRDRIGLILNFLYLFFGGYHLFLFIKRRREKYNLIFSILSLSAFIYLTGRSGLFFETGLDSTIGYKIELMSVYLIPLSLGIFLEYLFFEKIGKFFKFYSFYCALLLIITPFTPQHMLIYILRAWQISALISAGLFFYIFYKAIKAESDSAKRLFIGFTIMISAAIFDVLDSMYFKTGWIITRYAFFMFIVGIVGILANRFLNLHETIENLNKTLEQKVEIRPRELQATLKEVRLLKEQQDGDYFLTTLIIEPLASNIRGDEKIDLKILIHQKKKFEFKKKTHEIGGDICISESIYLKGKKYTAFINGDAMGKSIQGAGGALVLGVVFKSILSRAKAFSTKESVFPERWLKLAFQELQSIFVTFDGLMMVSVVMGLVDNERGFIYYINAEHPFCVLYRDNKASFIETELNFRKIGFTTMEYSGEFQVYTFKLENGDVIIMGSDGRDDIKIGTNEKGSRIINDDGSLFLKTVEEGDGNLESIFNITERKGELIDDYSLLRIKYNDPTNQLYNSTEESEKALEYYNIGNYPNAEKIIEKAYHSRQINKTIVKLRADIAFKKGIYNKAAEYYTEYMDLFPEDNSALLDTAISYKLSGEFDLAADYSERLKLREPTNVPNLILLSEIYFNLKAMDRAKKILDNAILIDPGNPTLIELKTKLLLQL